MIADLRDDRHQVCRARWQRSEVPSSEPALGPVRWHARGVVTLRSIAPLAADGPHSLGG